LLNIHATGEVHFWISVVLESMGQAGLSDFLRRFPLLGRVFMKLYPSWLAKLVAGSAKHEAYTIDLINKYESYQSTPQSKLFLNAIKAHTAGYRQKRLHELFVTQSTRGKHIGYSIGGTCI
jgi:hypothetical protein